MTSEAHKLTRAEKNAIIINEAKGIQHPDFYVYTTKSGVIQVRKRKNKLTDKPDKEVKEVKENVERAESPELQRSDDKEPVKEDKVDEAVKEVKTKTDYETVSNKQLLEKMLLILEKTTESKNQKLNDVEREKETEENKQFVEGIKNKVERVESPKTQRVEVLDKSEESSERAESPKTQRGESLRNQPVRKSRNILQPVKPTAQRPPTRKGRNILN